MPIESEPKLYPDLEKPNEQVLYIEIDDIPDVEEFVASIKNLPTEEQLVRISDFIKSKFKNAISPHNKNLPQVEKIKLKKCLDKNLKNYQKLFV